MSRKTEYITCLNCGNKKAIVTYNPKTGKRIGYYCPCMKPNRDKEKNPKPDDALNLKTLFN